MMRVMCVSIVLLGFVTGPALAWEHGTLNERYGHRDYFDGLNRLQDQWRSVHEDWNRQRQYEELERRQQQLEQRFHEQRERERWDRLLNTPREYRRW